MPSLHLHIHLSCRRIPQIWNFDDNVSVVDDVRVVDNGVVVMEVIDVVVVVVVDVRVR